MTISNKFAPIVLSVFLVSCATPYSRAISVAHLSDRMVEITSAGNSDTNIARLRDYSKLAAAQMCISNGFSHFAELGSETSLASTNWGGLSRATRVYFFLPSEQLPKTALNCKRIKSSLTPKYNRRTKTQQYP